MLAVLAGWAEHLARQEAKEEPGEPEVAAAAASWVEVGVVGLSVCSRLQKRQSGEQALAQSKGTE